MMRADKVYHDCNISLKEESISQEEDLIEKKSGLIRHHEYILCKSEACDGKIKRRLGWLNTITFEGNEYQVTRSRVLQDE